MPRHHISDPRVGAVIDGLVRAFLQHESVNAVAEALSSTGDTMADRVYPNRVHGLLSDDPTRSVNTATLEALERALERLSPVVDPQVRTEFEQKVAAAAAALPSSVGDVARDVAGRLGVPLAVVRALIPEVAAPNPIRIASSKEPDWSWQETALKSILSALDKPGWPKVGLIVPTGGGKTRLGLRAILSRLVNDPRTDAVALWVTHRRNLRRAARRELQELLRSHEAVPDKAADLFSRIHFVMVHDLRDVLAEYSEKITVVVVDEAHHAAATSYQSLFDGPTSPGLFLTATPNRMDALPIGIDEVGYTVSYRELFERGCVIEPTFDPPLELSNLDWSTPLGLRDLADYLLERAENDFGKVLVAVSLQSRTAKLYEALNNALDEYGDHPLDYEDLGFVHGGRNSSGLPDASDFLDEFSARPKGILVATSQLIGEGFDDPSIDAVVVTYPSASIGHLMQVAGRALRWAPGKAHAHVVQVRESPLEYHFDQRWLYQDISDALRPHLVDLTYSSREELVAAVDDLLAGHHVAAQRAERIRAELAEADVGGDLHLMLSGIHWFGDPEDFADCAEWSALLVTPDERERFLRVFNDVSVRTEDIKEHGDYLANVLIRDPAAGSTWKAYIDLVEAMEYARREIYGEPYAGASGRAYRRGLSTTWLRYVTFAFRPTVSAELEAFLHDAGNREEVLALYSDEPNRWAAAIKVLLPLTGSHAYLLDHIQRGWFVDQRQALVDALKDVRGLAAFEAVDSWAGGLTASPLPIRAVREIDQFTRPEQFAGQYLGLTSMDEEPEA